MYPARIKEDESEDLIVLDEDDDDLEITFISQSSGDPGSSVCNGSEKSASTVAAAAASTLVKLEKGIEAQKNQDPTKNQQKQTRSTIKLEELGPTKTQQLNQWLTVVRHSKVSSPVGSPKEIVKDGGPPISASIARPFSSTSSAVELEVPLVTKSGSDDSSVNSERNQFPAKSDPVVSPAAKDIAPVLIPSANEVGEVDISQNMAPPKNDIVPNDSPASSSTTNIAPPQIQALCPSSLRTAGSVVKGIVLPTPDFVPKITLSPSTAAPALKTSKLKPGIPPQTSENTMVIPRSRSTTSQPQRFTSPIVIRHNSVRIHGFPLGKGVEASVYFPPTTTGMRNANRTMIAHMGIQNTAQNNIPSVSAETKHNEIFKALSRIKSRGEVEIDEIPAPSTPSPNPVPLSSAKAELVPLGISSPLMDVLRNDTSDGSSSKSQVMTFYSSNASEAETSPKPTVTVAFTTAERNRNLSGGSVIANKDAAGSPAVLESLALPFLNSEIPLSSTQLQRLSEMELQPILHNSMPPLSTQNSLGRQKRKGNATAAALRNSTQLGQKGSRNSRQLPSSLPSFSASFMQNPGGSGSYGDDYSATGKQDAAAANLPLCWTPMNADSSQNISSYQCIPLGIGSQINQIPASSSSHTQKSKVSGNGGVNTLTSFCSNKPIPRTYANIAPFNSNFPPAFLMALAPVLMPNAAVQRNQPRSTGKVQRNQSPAESVSSYTSATDTTESSEVSLKPRRKYVRKPKLDADGKPIKTDRRSSSKKATEFESQGNSGSIATSRGIQIPPGIEIDFEGKSVEPKKRQRPRKPAVAPELDVAGNPIQKPKPVRKNQRKKNQLAAVGQSEAVLEDNSILAKLESFRAGNSQNHAFSEPIFKDYGAKKGDTRAKFELLVAAGASRLEPAANPQQRIQQCMNQSAMAGCVKANTLGSKKKITFDQLIQQKQNNAPLITTLTTTGVSSGVSAVALGMNMNVASPFPYKNVEGQQEQEQYESVSGTGRIRHNSLTTKQKLLENLTSSVTPIVKAANCNQELALFAEAEAVPSPAQSGQLSREEYDAYLEALKGKPKIPEDLFSRNLLNPSMTVTVQRNSGTFMSNYNLGHPPGSVNASKGLKKKGANQYTSAKSIAKRELSKSLEITKVRRKAATAKNSSGVLATDKQLQKASLDHLNPSVSISSVGTKERGVEVTTLGPDLEDVITTFSMSPPENSGEVEPNPPPQSTVKPPRRARVVKTNTTTNLPISFQNEAVLFKAGQELTSGQSLAASSANLVCIPPPHDDPFGFHTSPNLSIEKLVTPEAVHPDFEAWEKGCSDLMTTLTDLKRQGGTRAEEPLSADQRSGFGDSFPTIEGLLTSAQTTGSGTPIGLSFPDLAITHATKGVSAASSDANKQLEGDLASIQQRMEGTTLKCRGNGLEKSEDILLKMRELSVNLADINPRIRGKRISRKTVKYAAPVPVQRQIIAANSSLQNKTTKSPKSAAVITRVVKNLGFSWTFTEEELAFIFRDGQFFMKRDDLETETEKLTIWKVLDSGGETLTLKAYEPYSKKNSNRFFHVSNWVERDPLEDATREYGAETVVFEKNLRDVFQNYLPVYVDKICHSPEISVVKLYRDDRFFQHIPYIYKMENAWKEHYYNVIRALIYYAMDPTFLDKVIISDLAPETLSEEAIQLRSGWSEIMSLIGQTCHQFFNSERWTSSVIFPILKFPKMTSSSKYCDKSRNCSGCSHSIRPLHLPTKAVVFEGVPYDYATLMPTEDGHPDNDVKPSPDLQFCHACNNFLRSFHSLYHMPYHMLSTILFRLEVMQKEFPPDAIFDSISVKEAFDADIDWFKWMLLDFLVNMSQIQMNMQSMGRVKYGKYSGDGEKNEV